jgi:hypothetical protein
MKLLVSFCSLAEHCQRQIHSDLARKPMSANLLNRDAMSWEFPTDRAAKRQSLLDAVDRVRADILCGAEEAEAMTTLPIAAQHFMVSNSAYENYAKCLVGLPDVHPSDNGRRTR